MLPNEPPKTFVGLNNKINLILGIIAHLKIHVAKKNLFSFCYCKEVNNWKIEKKSENFAKERQILAIYNFHWKKYHGPFHLICGIRF